MDSQPTDANGMEDDALLSLWETAAKIADRRCQPSLVRLRHGAGGFYDHDDFQQDLFLEFLDLAQQIAEEPIPADAGDGEGPLWDRWQRILWGDGQRVLRRQPQRLWNGAIDGPADTVSAPDEEMDVVDPIDRYATDAPSPEETQTIAGEIDRLEGALWGLTPCERQILYMVTMADQRPSEVAALLRLSANSVYQHTHHARELLRVAMAIAPDAQEGS